MGHIGTKLVILFLLIQLLGLVHYLHSASIFPFSHSSSFRTQVNGYVRSHIPVPGHVQM